MSYSNSTLFLHRHVFSLQIVKFREKIWSIVCQLIFSQCSFHYLRPHNDLVLPFTLSHAFQIVSPLVKCSSSIWLSFLGNCYCTQRFVSFVWSYSINSSISMQHSKSAKLIFTPRLLSPLTLNVKSSYNWFFTTINFLVKSVFLILFF